MANIKKSFNFRNGVQVDDDNLKVSATGLVGIGTTVPTEALDVRGGLVVSGVTSAVTLQAGVATITTLNPTEIIGAGVSIKSGIVTASSGIITYFGDGINLLNLPTSQWEDTIVGAGVSSIYNTGGNVGIATTAALFTLQVGNDVNSGQKGVGISSFGDIKASGIVTATGFVGGLTGDITGNISTGTIISGIVTATGADINGDLDVDGHTNLDNVNISGLTTFINSSNTAGLRARTFATTSGIAVGELRVLKSPDNTISTGGPMIQFYTDDTPAPLNGPGNTDTISFYTSLFAGQFVQDGSLQLNKNFNVVGISTFTGNIDANGSIDVDGLAELDDVNVSGASTFFGRIEGAMTNNVIPFLYSNLAALPNAGDYHGAFAHVHSEGRAYFAHAGQWWELVNKEADGRIGTGTEEVNVGDINSAGIITCGTELNSPLIGVGTASPAHDIQVRKSGNAEIQVTSDTGIAGVTVGRESAGLKTNNAELRYGGGPGFTYSSAQALDILNYGTGNFNFHLSANNGGAANGSFFWHLGNNNSRLMTLTSTGRLGIGITQPTREIDVTGAGNFSGDLNVGNNLTVSGAVIGNVQGQLTGNVTGTLAGNANATVGISTLNNLSIAGVATVSTRLDATTIEVGATNTEFPFTVNNSDERTFITGTGGVGIKTTSTLTNVTINASQANASIAAVAIGATVLKSAVDFADAGTVTTRFMLPPKVSNAERGNLTGLVSGAMIYNTNLNKLQVYNGSAWETITSS